MNKVLAASLMAASLATFIGLTACAGAHRPAPAVTHTVAAPAATAPAAAAPASPATDADTAWCNGTGWSDEQMAISVIGQLEGNESFGDTLAAEGYGSQLASEAEVSRDLPYPSDVSGYVQWMGDYITAGKDASGGDFTDATTELADANSILNGSMDAAYTCGN
jgi:hypothetical protein